MNEIENRMVIDVKRAGNEIGAVESKLTGPGFTEMKTGVFVSKDDAFDYALDQCIESPAAGMHGIKWTKEFMEMLVEWFYSDNWIRED